MAYQGQVCCAGSRTYVHEDIYEKFVELAKEKAEKKVIADVLNPNCEHGPQVSNLKNYWFKSSCLAECLALF